MSRIVVTEYVTLDGVMEAPGGGEKFELGGWSFKFWNDQAAKFKFDELFASDALLLGRVTYEGFSRAWPTVKDDQGFGDRMNHLPKYVVSTTLKEGEWHNSRLIKENVREEIAKLKQQHDMDILVSGSAKLVQSLAKFNLVDEYRLMVHPIVLGSGKRLFDDGFAAKVMKLVDTIKLDSGIVILTYHPDGK